MKLYKYRSLNGESLKWTKDILSKKRLFMSRFDKMNDPMEGVFDVTNMTEEAVNDIKEDKTGYRILSLTRSPYNMLMWSHYGDSHKGCCIEIDVDEDQLKRKNYFLKHITYNNEELLCPSHELTAFDYLCKKLTPWQYEDEWRILSDSSNIESGVCYLKNVTITKVYLGCKFNTNESSIMLVEFKELLKKYDVEHVSKLSLKNEILGIANNRNFVG